MRKIQFIIIGEYEVDETKLSEAYGNEITTIEEAASLDKKQLVEGVIGYDEFLEGHDLEGHDLEVIFRVLDP